MSTPAVMLGGGSRLSGRLATALVAMVLVAVAGAAPAQTYNGRMGVRETVEYDDNPLLTSRQHEAVWSSITAPEATVTAEAPAAKLELNARGVVNRYSDAAFDSNDAHLKATGALRGEVVKFGLDGTLDYDTTRTSELTGTGTIVAGVRHLDRSLSPSLSVSLSAVDMLSVQSGYDRVEYDSDRYTNYETWSLSPSYSRAFSPRDTGQLMLMASRFTTLTERWSEVDSLGPVAGWDHRFSERLRVSGYLGRRFSTSRSYLGTEAKTRGYLVNLAVAYEGQQDDFRLSVDRSLSPLGNGTQVQSDKVDGNWIHAVAPLIDAELRLQYIKQSGLSDNSEQDRTYYSVEPRIRFKLTENWNLSPTYRLRQQTSGTNKDEAQSHAVLLTIGYRGSRFALD